MPTPEQWFPMPGGAWIRLRMDRESLAADLAVFEARDAAEPVAVLRELLGDRGECYSEGDARAEKAAEYLEELRSLYHQIEPGVTFEQFTHLFLVLIAQPETERVIRGAMRRLPRRVRAELEPKVAALLALHRQGVTSHG